MSAQLWSATSRSHRPMTAVSRASESCRTMNVPEAAAAWRARMCSRSSFRLRISFVATSWASWPLPLAVGKELGAEGELYPVAFGLGNTLDVHLEIDGTHDAVPELLVDHRLDGGAVD